MKNIFIINAHEEYEFSKGELNKSLVSRLKDLLPNEDFEIKTTTMKDNYNIDDEISKHQWADIVIVQSIVKLDGNTMELQKISGLCILFWNGW